MRNIYIILLTLISVFSDTQAENRQKSIDSIQNRLKTTPQDTNRVNLLNSLSDQFIEQDQYDSSIYFSTQAQKLAQRLSFEYGKCASLRLIGVANTCNGQYSKALTYLFQALKISESIKNNYLIAKILNSIGANFNIQKDYDSALSYFFKSLSYYYNPVIYENIARSYHLKNKEFLAIEFYKKALSSIIPQIEKSYIYNDLGDIMEHQNNLDTALIYYFKSLNIANELHDDAGIGDASGSIGDLYLKHGKLKNAIYYEKQSLETAKKIHSKWEIIQSTKSLSEIYENINASKSLYYYKNYISERDSIYSEENTKRNTQTEMNFYFDKKQAMQKVKQDKKDVIAFHEKQKQKIIIYSIIIGLLLVIMFTVFIFRSLRITRKQKHIIELQKYDVENRKKIIEDKNKEMSDATKYASRIQQAILPTENIMQNIMPEHFVYFAPKDFIGGDFYFADKIGDKIFWGVADATGHSSNGGLLSMLGVNILSGIIKDGEFTPSNILNKLNERLNESLHKTSDDSIRDGMDVAFCSMNLLTKELEYAGANNPLWILKNNGELLEIRANKIPIGQIEQIASYTNNKIQLESGDVIYAFSDGICDLHSENNKKFMKKRFRELILSVKGKTMIEQREIIIKTLMDWKGNAEAVDDMLLIGVKV